MSQYCSRTLLVAFLLGLVACSSQATLTTAQGTGPDPVLPAPDRSLIPTVEIAPATGWPAGVMPTPAAGLEVNAFARDFEHPRWLYVLPNGDVLVAETNGPPDSSAIGGIKGWVMSRVMKKAGAAVPSANRISLLRDADHDGVVELRTVFLSGLSSPFGMALVDDVLYVANADVLMQYDYRAGDTRIESAGRKLTDLPHGPGSLNHHWTKSLVASADGSRLYVGVGSNSNVAEGGMDKETNRAAILEIDRLSGATRIFASGLRNPVGLAWNPQTGALWAVVNERDELGDDLVPDYLTRVREGGFYGWPYSYYGKNLDPRVDPQRPELVASALVPDYALGSHVAPLGLAFNTSTHLPTRLAGGAFVALHGSWNREPPSGYKVILVPFGNGLPNRVPMTVLDDFVDAEGNARGRPVGVAIAADGALLVADDVGNTVWRLTSAATGAGQ